MLTYRYGAAIATHLASRLRFGESGMEILASYAPPGPDFQKLCYIRPVIL